MSTPVTLPGDLPGLDLTNAPLRLDGSYAATGLLPSRSEAGLWDIAFVTTPDRTFALWIITRAAGRLELVLSPLGMDIAARWLAERLGLAVGLTAPSFTFVHTSEDGPAHWRLSGVYAEVCFYTEPVFGVALRSCRPPFVVPNLTLDPAKGPEALATICLHVAGRRT